MLASLLCCGLDAKDEQDDKYNRPPPNRVAATPGTTNKKTLYGATAAPSATAAKGDKPLAAAKATPTKAKSKKELDDDHSINETDTITNTNEDSNPAPALHTQANDHDSAPNGKASEKPMEAEETSTAAPVATVDENDANGDESMQGDGESISDLTKIQEGQAFDPTTGRLLPAKDVARFGEKKCLVLDLDETLVHSSFKYLRTADFVIPVEIDNQVHHVYVIKRPGVDEFLRKVGKWYEVVVFTASVAKYGDPLLNKLDINHVVHHRLFRDSCYSYQGNYIKNLSQIGRPLADTVIIDNSPASYIFHPNYSIPISSWFSDTHDNELLDLLPLLEDIAKPNVDDVSLVLDTSI